MSPKKSPKAAVTVVGDEQQRLARRAAERWTLQEAAAELSEQFHQVMSPADWLAVLEKLVPTEFVHSPNGEVQADELNALLDAHPRWKAIGTPRLPSARKTAEHVAGAWDYSMHAAYWFDMAAVTPREAAGLLCQSDPLFEKANPENNTNDETGPDDFRLLLRVFLDVERSDPGCRTLLEWLKIAKARECRHHSWVDRYLEAREQLGFPVVSIKAKPDNAPVETSGASAARYRQATQEKRILELLRAQGHEPLKLPPRANGKPGVKFEIRKVALSDKPLIFSNNSFDKAWQRLRGGGEIAGGE